MYKLMLKNHMSLTDYKRERSKINNLIEREKYFSKIIVMKTNKTPRLYDPYYVKSKVQNKVK